jgi:hypothetical protein
MAPEQGRFSTAQRDRKAWWDLLGPVHNAVLGLLMAIIPLNQPGHRKPRPAGQLGALSVTILQPVAWRIRLVHHK